MKLLGTAASNKTLKVWLNVLVYPTAPFFLTDEMKSQLPDYVHLSRAEFRATSRDLSFHDSYGTYNVKPEGAWVMLLNNHQFQTLPDTLRLELLQLQASLGRGQVYKFDEYKDLLEDSELEQAQRQIFFCEEKTMLELNHTLWNSFSFETRKRWLKQFVSEDRSECLSGQLSKKEWQSINKRCPPIKHLVGFVDSSGPNCFATTLAALLDVEKAKGISSLWLQRETFLREIEKRGYQKSELEVNANLPGGSILVWQNDNGLQHACLYLGDGLVFNKDAQAWFAPRQILNLETVLESWREFDVCVYARGYD
jgi:hypothetical protein